MPSLALPPRRHLGHEIQRVLLKEVLGRSNVTCSATRSPWTSSRRMGVAAGAMLSAPTERSRPRGRGGRSSPREAPRGSIERPRTRGEPRATAWPWRSGQEPRSRTSSSSSSTRRPFTSRVRTGSSSPRRCAARGASFATGRGTGSSIGSTRSATSRPATWSRAGSSPRCASGRARSTSTCPHPPDADPRPVPADPRDPEGLRHRHPP